MAPLAIQLAAPLHHPPAEVLSITCREFHISSEIEHQKNRR